MNTLETLLQSLKQIPSINFFEEILKEPQALPKTPVNQAIITPDLLPVPVIQSDGQNSRISENEGLKSSTQLELKSLNPPITSTISIRKWNTLQEPFTIGYMNYPADGEGLIREEPFSGRLSSSDPVDYYRFFLSKTATLNAQLFDLVNNADLRLIHDANNNGKIDAGETIMSSKNLLNTSESLRVEGLGAGTYFLEVNSVNKTNTDYRLDVSATTMIPQEPSGFDGVTLRHAIPILGQLSGGRNFQGSVNADGDMSDFYRITLDHAVRFNAFLTPTLSNANLYLYHDANKDMSLQASELIGYSAQSGISTDSIFKEILPAGEYYLQVQKPINTGHTDYALDLYGAPVSQGRVTLDIKELKALQQFDSRTPFTNWHQADFYGTVRIDGIAQTFGTFQDKDVVTGLKFTQLVDPNKRFVDISIAVKEEDLSYDDWAKISGNDSIIWMRYDTVKQQVIATDGFQGTFGEGRNIHLQGDLGNSSSFGDTGYNSYGAAITFAVNYETVL